MLVLLFSDWYSVVTNMPKPRPSSVSSALAAFPAFNRSRRRLTASSPPPLVRVSMVMDDAEPAEPPCGAPAQKSPSLPVFVPWMSPQFPVLSSSRGSRMDIGRGRSRACAATDVGVNERATNASSSAARMVNRFDIGPPRDPVAPGGMMAYTTPGVKAISGPVGSSVPADEEEVTGLVAGELDRRVLGCLELSPDDPIGGRHHTNPQMAEHGLARQHSRVLTQNLEEHLGEDRVLATRAVE